ncbi:MAG: hypothetical protein CME65_11120 [Halobacteriovoraceae bacterium]|nr:hypothetical protein [Halobacteriovoraceae bacterium]|tara:strand:- start:7251 stop:8522 length:1272 start_codon:yes stop_codon:yes gene_type:complete
MKVAIVYSFKPSEWFSCTIINKNLREAYETVYDDIMYIDYTRKRTFEPDDIKKLAESDVEKIIFIDHQPTPIGFLDYLKKKYPDCFNRLEYTIHIFGDFPLFMPEWRTVFDLLDGMPLKFVTASEKQRKFITKFIKQEELISVCPFPVDSKKFNFRIESRNEARAKFGLTDEFIFLYTGRLTFQKNITCLIESFCELDSQELLPPNSLLYIVGGVDSLGVPYLGANQLLGEYFRSIQKTLEKFPLSKDKVVLTGRVENDELNTYYNLSDCYTSLSTYHDEDYGMSVAEALCSGLPAVITNWAGYHSFQLEKHPEYCQLVSTDISRTGPTFDQEDYRNKLGSQDYLKYDRTEISKIYQQNFSIKACAEKLENIQKSEAVPFQGTTGFMKRITNEQFLRGIEVFKSEATREFNDLYFEAYDVYAG